MSPMLGGEDFGIGSDLKAALREEADKRYRNLIPVLFDKLEEIIANALSKAVKSSDDASGVASETKVIDVPPQEPPTIQKLEDLPEEVLYERRERE